MIKATFYTEAKGYRPYEFERLLVQRFKSYTQNYGIGCWNSIVERSQSYIVIFDEYPDFHIDLEHLREKLRTELNQESVLVTIQTVEVL